MSFRFDPIAIVHSCFKEKFGIPRQAGLIPEARGSLEVLPPYDRPEAFRELEGYSHLWLLWVFDALQPELETTAPGWRPTVRPPRLGGNRRVGVFASRSPFRPNPIGLSLVRLLAIDYATPGISLQLQGLDLLEGTPVLDIKPYLPYADRAAEARAGFAPEAPRQTLEVCFSPRVEAYLERQGTDWGGHLRRLIGQILSQDPRPAYLHRNPTRQAFGMRLYDLDIHWRCHPGQALVTAIEPHAGVARRELRPHD